MGIFHCPLYVSSPEGNCFGMNLTPPGEASIWLQPSKWYFFFASCCYMEQKDKDLSEGHVKPTGTKEVFPEVEICCETF